jgi:hypothetical protein
MLFATLVIADSLALASCGYNLATLGNPLYPLNVRALGHTLFAGPESPEFDASYPSYIGPVGATLQFPEPVNFLLSASELDFTVRGVSPWYNIDMVTGRSARLGAPSRTGGWGGVFTLANLALLTFQLVARPPGSEGSQRRFAFAALALLVLTAFMPRAHELRYWLYVPVVLSAVNLSFLARCDARRAIPVTLAGFAVYGVALTLLSPNSELLRFRPITRDELAASTPPQVVRTLAEEGRFCDADDDTLFRYSSAVTERPGLVSSRAEDCR